MQVAVNRKNIKFNPDASRVIARFLFTTEERALNTIRSVLIMTKSEASKALSPVLRDFSLRHRNISKIFERNFKKISHLFKLLNIDPESLDISQKILIGSY
ncbi:MAG: hypothetical protein LC658_00590, partial [Bacteroidales bacterium]|nr:hypothetical protein [Bacteroidales bacterium]